MKRNKKFVNKDARNWFTYLLTGSSIACTSRSCVVQRGWWYSWPMASTLASLCLSQRRTFWTYVMTINLFSLYLINFTFHTMLDATGVVLRVHYKSMKCDVLFPHGSIRTVCSGGGHFSYTSKKIYSFLRQCKNYKNRSRFSKVMITNVLPPFLWFTVYINGIYWRYIYQANPAKNSYTILHIVNAGHSSNYSQWVLFVVSLSSVIIYFFH